MKVTTVTREYDNEGQLLRETTTVDRRMRRNKPVDRVTSRHNELEAQKLRNDLRAVTELNASITGIGKTIAEALNPKWQAN